MNPVESYRLTYLEQLEAESIHIIREVAATFERPVMLYSVGKDSSVMVRLAQKAFFPAPLPFPLMHVDTGLKFPEMYEFRDRFCEEIGARLVVYQAPEVSDPEVNPADLGTVRCCAILKTRALLDALRAGGYDAAMGGARREEERSRAKERVFSFRDANGQWDPKQQRPELWGLYNSRIVRGEHMRVFPLSNWTELDIWLYIERENITVVPLYFARQRPMIRRDGQLIPVYAQTRLQAGDEVSEVLCRCRTLGCYPCTGTVVSQATTIPDIVAEMRVARRSERITRIIDHDQDGSMEQKKREGYF